MTFQTRTSLAIDMPDLNTGEARVYLGATKVLVDRLGQHH